MGARAGAVPGPAAPPRPGSACSAAGADVGPRRLSRGPGPGVRSAGGSRRASGGGGPGQEAAGPAGVRCAVRVERGARGDQAQSRERRCEAGGDVPGVPGRFVVQPVEDPLLFVRRAQRQVEEHLPPGVGRVLDRAQRARVAVDPCGQHAHAVEAAAGQVLPARFRQDPGAQHQGREIVGGEDLRLLDDLSVRRHGAVPAGTGPFRAQPREAGRGPRTVRPGQRLARLGDRHVADDGVVDPVVALVQRAAQQLGCVPGRPEELRAEGSHEDVRGQFLHQRRAQVRLAGEHAELAYERVGQQRAGERTHGQFAELPQGGQGGFLGGRPVPAPVGHRLYPWQFLDPDLPLQVEQQQGAPVAEGPVRRGHQRAQRLFLVRLRRRRGHQLRHELGQHLGGRHHAAFHEGADRSAERALDDLADRRGDLRTGGQAGVPVLVERHRGDERSDVRRTDVRGQPGETAEHDLRQRVVRRQRRLFRLLPAQRGVRSGARRAALADHGCDGVPQQAEPAGVQRAPRDDLLQRAAQHGQVLLGAAVLAAERVLLCQRPVLPQQFRATLEPVAVGGDLARPPRLQPVREQFVRERQPDRQRLPLCLHRHVRPAAGEGPAGVVDGTAVHGQGVRRGGVRRPRQETQAARERLQDADEFERTGDVARADQPRHREQRRLLRHGHRVASAVQQVPQGDEAGLGQEVVEQRPAFGGHAGLAGGLRLVRQQGAARGGASGHEAAVDDLGGDPGGQAGDRSAGADPQPSVGHLVDHVAPATYPLLRAVACPGVLVRQRGGEGLGQLPVHVRRRCGEGLLLSVLVHKPTWRVPPPRPPGPEPGALLLSYTSMLRNASHLPARCATGFGGDAGPVRSCRGVSPPPL